MPMPTFAVTTRLPRSALDLLAAAGELRATEAGKLAREELLAHVAGADVVLTQLGDRVDGELLDAAGSQLRCVANVATADLTLGLILAATRRLGEGERLIRSGRPWAWGMDFMLGRGLRGKRLGVVGLGAIGARVAERARAFGMTIAYNNRHEAPTAVTAPLAAERLELGELLASADVLTLHCPLTEQTRHLIGPAELAAMKPTATLVNTARGPVVDEAALVAALREGEIAAAGLDVFEHEPEVHPGLVELENVVLVPHLGSATVETRTAMAELAARNALAAAAGEPLLTPVG
jgi:glyoxylate reductase